MFFGSNKKLLLGLLLSISPYVAFGAAYQYRGPAQAVSQASWSGKANAIYFYGKTAPYYAFTNFFHLKPQRGHGLAIDGKNWRSTEHYFQAQKFIYNQGLYNQIFNANTSRDAFTLAQQNSAYVRPDWVTPDASGLAPRDYAMLRALWAKFSQNADLQRLLLGTGNKTLIEDSPLDEYWGRGAHWQGRNHLGQMLMYVRWCLNRHVVPSAQNPYRPRGATAY
jgi:N-glycosidase YbiA